MHAPLPAAMHNMQVDVQSHDEDLVAAAVRFVPSLPQHHLALMQEIGGWQRGGGGGRRLVGGSGGEEGAAYWWLEEEEIVGWSEQRVGRPMPYTVASLESIWADPALSLPPPPFPLGGLDAVLLVPLPPSPTPPPFPLGDLDALLLAPHPSSPLPLPPPR